MAGTPQRAVGNAVRPMSPGAAPPPSAVPGTAQAASEEAGRCGQGSARDAGHDGKEEEAGQGSQSCAERSTIPGNEEAAPLRGSPPAAASSAPPGDPIGPAPVAPEACPGPPRVGLTALGKRRGRNPLSAQPVATPAPALPQEQRHERLLRFKAKRRRLLQHHQQRQDPQQQQQYYARLAGTAEGAGHLKGLSRSSNVRAPGGALAGSLLQAGALSGGVRSGVGRSLSSNAQAEGGYSGESKPASPGQALSSSMGAVQAEPQSWAEGSTELAAIQAAFAECPHEGVKSAAMDLLQALSLHSELLPDLLSLAGPLSSPSTVSDASLEATGRRGPSPWLATWGSDASMAPHGASAAGTLGGGLGQKAEALDCAAGEDGSQGKAGAPRMLGRRSEVLAEGAVQEPSDALRQAGAVAGMGSAGGLWSARASEEPGAAGQGSRVQPSDAPGDDRSISTSPERLLRRHLAAPPFPGSLSTLRRPSLPGRGASPEARAQEDGEAGGGLFRGIMSWARNIKAELLLNPHTALGETVKGKLASVLQAPQDQDPTRVGAACSPSGRPASGSPTLAEFTYSAEPPLQGEKGSGGKHLTEVQGGAVSHEGQGGGGENWGHLPRLQPVEHVGMSSTPLVRSGHLLAPACSSLSEAAGRSLALSADGTECALGSGQLEGLGLIPEESPDAWLPSLGFGGSPWLAGQQDLEEEREGSFIPKQGLMEQLVTSTVPLGDEEVTGASDSGAQQELTEAEACPRSFWEDCLAAIA